MATAVWDRQYAGMESGESFQRSGPADCEGICLDNEKFINFAYWITSYAPVFEYICNGTAYYEQATLTGTAETGKSIENLGFAEMLSPFAQIPGDVDSVAWR